MQRLHTTSAMKKIEAETDIEQMFILLLYYENLIACLLKMFEKGNDFRKQPDVINRNFIDFVREIETVNAL